MGDAAQELKANAAQPLGVRSVLLVLLTVTLWGGNAVAVSFSVDTLPPVAVAAVRFMMATAFMFIWCRVEGSDLRLSRSQIVPVLLAGFGLFLQIATFHVGVELSNSSHASMMLNTFVFWVVLLEHFITKHDRLTLLKVGGLMLAFGSVVILLLRSDNGQTSAAARDVPTLLGDSILLLSGVVLAVKVIYVKHALKSIEPGKLIFWHDVVGVCFFCVYSCLFEQVEVAGFTKPAMIALVYQGVLVAGLCFALNAWLMRRHSASQIAVFSFISPVVGVSAGILFRGDQATSLLLGVAICVAVGILLVNLRVGDASRRRST